MRFMGFGNKWISFIHACLPSSTISVLINGSLTKEFSPRRGIRLDDPISPFLFIIVAEGLNILSKRAISNEQFRGLSVGHDNVIVSHLQYADDTIFFRLKVNLKKSNLYGIGVPKIEVDAMASYINCSAGSSPFTYLGLPIGVPTSNASTWLPIIEKYDKRLSDCKAKSISFDGRLTLTKSVLSSIPLYFFSLFHAPVNIITTLESKRRNFF
ncbi:uncharacterized protein [Rutidosis leptorrhynchoides]|uniref:uncharacterized protein n=1 Tax=Rutidosis leptorrhynchoides TaxID=125765 RepID=UPI003A99B5B1